MFDRIIDRLALTKTEQRIILFLCGTFTLGVCIRFYQDAFPNAPQFDYRAVDSTFAALSDKSVTEDSSEGLDTRPLHMNLNTATKEQLMKLPGVGDVTAERIMLYRDEHDGFGSIEELRQVKGISTKKLEKLKPLLTLH
jgi:competence ComEA-like helix-hairpin-helix protein